MNLSKITHLAWSCFLLGLMSGSFGCPGTPQSTEHPVVKVRTASVSSSVSGLTTAAAAADAPARRSYGEVFVEDYGAVGYDPPAGTTVKNWASPKGMVDSAPAIQAALDAMPAYGVLRFAHCRYWVGTTIVTKVPGAIVMSESIDRVSYCGLMSKYGITGLQLDASMTVRGLFLRADGRPTNPDGSPLVFNSGAHGVLMEETSDLAGVYVYGFEGDGIHIEASVPAHNANQWSITGGSAAVNKGYGLYVRGSDSNAGVAIRFSSVLNGIANYHDNSFLGNTYLGCHSDVTKASYESGWEMVAGVRTENRNNHNTFIGCYEEDGETADLGSGTIWIGGMGQSLTTGNGSVLRVDGNGFQSPHFAAATVPGIPQARLGGLGGGTTIMEWWTPKSKTPIYVYPSTATARAGAIDITHALNSSRISLSVSTSSSAEGAGFAYAPDGIRMGANTVVGMGAIPTTGAWKRGDLVLNTNAASNAPWGWSCTVAGTPGTWRALTSP